MSWPALPDWLEELQARFGQLLRTPLSRESGALRAETGAYDPILVNATRPSAALSSAERLAVYHRQYWFRLFTVLQGAYPLTARLLGFWRFNQLAASFLTENPPASWDIDSIGAGLDAFVARAGAPVTIPQQALSEAARIDAAFQRVFRAPAVVAYRPGPDDSARLAVSRLQPSPAFAIVREHWPLCELRPRALESESPVALPPAHPEERHWLIGRELLTIGVVPLAAREAELLELLGQHAVGEALALLEERCSEAEQRQLPTQARLWLSRSVQLGVWVGAVPE